MAIGVNRHLVVVLNLLRRWQMAFAAGNVEGQPGGSFGRKEKDNRAHMVVQLHDLEGPRVGHLYQHRQRRQSPEEGAAAIGAATHNDRRPEDDPVEPRSHQGLIAFQLRGSYFAIGTWVVAEVLLKLAGKAGSPVSRRCLWHRL